MKYRMKGISSKRIQTVPTLPMSSRTLSLITMDFLNTMDNFDKILTLIYERFVMRGTFVSSADIDIMNQCLELIDAFVTEENVNCVVEFYGPRFITETTLLYHSVQFSAPPEIVKALLKLGANVEYHPYELRKCISVAIANDRMDIVRILSDHSAEIGQNSIALALRSGWMDEFVDICKHRGIEVISRCAYECVNLERFDKFQEIFKKFPIDVNIIVAKNTILSRAMNMVNLVVYGDWGFNSYKVREDALRCSYDILATGRVDLKEQVNRWVLPYVDREYFKRYVARVAWKRRREVVFIRRSA